MEVAYRCHACHHTCVAHDVDETTRSLTCAACGQQLDLPADAIQDGKLTRCLICPCRELFVRKDFNQRTGIAVIVIGFLLSTVAWAFRKPIMTFAILFATAAIDMVLYFTVGNLVECYRCHAEYRDLGDLEAYDPFSLETHERFRQEAARLELARSEAGRPTVDGDD